MATCPGTRTWPSVVAFAVSAWLAPALAQEPPATVVAIHWSTEDFPGAALLDSSIRTTLSESGQRVDYHAEYLESDRFPDQGAPALREYIRRKYHGRPIDLVLALHDTPLQFVRDQREALFPGASIVYLGYGPPDAATITEGPGLTGVVMGAGFRETLALALEMHPSTERVFVVAEAPGFTLREEVERALAPLAARVDLTYLAEPSVEDLVGTVAALPPRSLVLYIRYSEEEPGRVLLPVDVARLVADASPVPVYGVSEAYFETGVVGGAVHARAALGAQVGTLALRVLAGARPQDLPVEYPPLVPTFDWRQVQRWRIDQARLPPTAVLLHRVPSVWESYGWYIAGALALLVFQGLMIAALVRDVAERKRAEAALRDSRERYALATSAGNVGVWDWNLETGEMYVDPALKALLGYDDHEIRNHLDDWGRFVHPDDAAVVMQEAQTHLEGRSPLYEIEHRMRHRDGSVRWFLARGSAVWRDGRAVRMIGTDTDITERRRSEQALDDAQAELARVSKLITLGEFAASIAHEIRQPLTAIVVNAQTCLRWLAAAPPNLPEVRAALSDVVDEGRRADSLIRHSRDMFRHRAPERDPLDLNEVIRQAVAMAQQRLQTSHVRLALDLMPGLPEVSGDRVELQQVLLNLIANAIDAMEAADPRARCLDIDTRLTDTAFVEVSVRDQGVGLAQVEMERMFTLSYTTKPDGTGVGLSISRSIVEAHGGRLWAESNASGGATFTFSVPLYLETTPV